MNCRKGCQVSLHLYTYSSPFRPLQDDAFVIGNNEPTGYIQSLLFTSFQMPYYLLTVPPSFLRTDRDDRYARLPSRFIIQVPIAHHTR